MTSRELHLLVLGSPRSGTTLLSAMLSCHPDVCLLNEELTGASLRIFSKRVKGVKLCAPHQIELEHPRAMRADDWARMQLRRGTNVARWLVGEPLPLGGFRKSRLSIRDYQRAVDRLAVIGIVRSPGQVIGSIMRRGHQSRSTAEYRWRRLIEILYQLVQEGGQTEVSIVHFDDLVRQPEETLRKTLSAIGCEYDPAVQEGFRHTPQYRGRSEIDSSLAGPGLGADLRHPLLVSDPGLAAKYRVLYECTI